MNTQINDEPVAMLSRRLGPDQLVVSAIGLGCMGMTWGYGKADRTESIATIHRALDLGVTLFDTADIYGPFLNEELIGEALAGHRQEVVLATKCGLQVPDASVFHHDASKFSLTRNGSPQHILKSCDESLRRLRTNYIDLYQLHRVDAVKDLAKRKNATPAQIALAWLLALGENVVPIPGVSKRNHLEENLGSAFVQLTKEEQESLNGLPSPTGGRY
jgi:aryl-alcohol dehydrogenase-like predicted oxidoreductase